MLYSLSKKYYLKDTFRVRFFTLNYHDNLIAYLFVSPQTSDHSKMGEEKKHIQQQVKRMHDEIQHASEQKKNLKHNELFILDNSLRESTVGQLRGHTIENKWKIYEQVGVYYSKFLI